MNERDDFGPALRRERERRGISLQAVADQTKIRGSFFAAMERNDFSQWPGGLFRRSFMRAYAEAVGLDAERVVADLARLFPGEEKEAEREAHRRNWRKVAIASCLAAVALGATIAAVVAPAHARLAAGVAAASIVGVVLTLTLGRHARPAEVMPQETEPASPPPKAQTVTVRRRATPDRPANRTRRPRRPNRSRPRA